ncbi:MAG: TlpA disulfide reductase family protein [Reichenbachiella sp.]|uniref:TlpA family protein disulfide reductase n=1 Tax=Reichenbachiella sp. TaxID=2184521 RepID=UPI00296629E6|nr:TlpA disulfide reductase family protein [Reichenbachiella sp.]MDW3209329.1 TlpA disulfide reductase family protein [Reichenbachiella sp.]
MKKILKDWWFIIGLVCSIYFFGYAEVAGFFQRVILSTGIIQADVLDENEQYEADYDFKLLDEQGSVIDFSQFKGQTVFLNFWATWCPPCVAEMPDIHDLYKKMQGENVAFVLISRDENFDKAKNFIERKSYTFPIYKEASPLPSFFERRSIPSTFVISPEGKIIAMRIGMAKYDTEEFRTLLRDGSTYSIQP